MNEQVPRNKSLDSTITLLKNGYTFIKNNVDGYQSDIFETHLLGEKVICISGEEAAKIFYNSELFKRQDAVPKRIQKTLFGLNAIQGMDGEAHAHRKHLFMSLMTPSHQKYLTELTMEKWEERINEWKDSEEIILFNEAKEILCWVACYWAGVPLAESEIRNRADDFSNMVNAFGGVGPRYFKGRYSRLKTEDWIKGIIKDVRARKYEAKKGSPLYEIAFYRDLDGNQLDDQIAAVELINIIRPIVAISTFITFAALALHEHPQCRDLLINGNNDDLEMFVQEVRRYYPFAPFLGARVKENFMWNHYEFREGTLVILDIYGTNHDAKIWEDPYEFNPERFKNWDRNLFSFLPQGGGETAKGHRCPGEDITVEIMKVSIDFLVNKIEFQVSKQDLTYSIVKMPTLPKSGFIMHNIKSIHINK